LIADILLEVGRNSGSHSSADLDVGEEVYSGGDACAADDFPGRRRGSLDGGAHDPDECVRCAEGISIDLLLTWL